LIEGAQNIGVVMYYGMPVRDVEKLKTLNSDVLGLFATEQYISKEIIEDFAAKMKEAGKKLDYKIFEGVHVLPIQAIRNTTRPWLPKRMGWHWDI